MPTVFNVKGYGATGDGITDDGASIQLAVDDAISNGGGIVFFPAGTYRPTTSISVVSSPIQVEGSGPGTSNINFSGCHGFVINNFAAPDKYPVQFYNLSIQSDDLGLYNGIDFTGEPNPTISKQLTMRNIEITGTNNRKYWDIGLKLTYGHYSDIRNCTFRGYTADIKKMRYGVYLDGSTDVKSNY